MLFISLTFFSNAIQVYNDVAGLYGKSFSFFDDIAPIFAKDRAYGYARDDIEDDDANQYEQDNNVILEEGAGFSQVAIDVLLCLMNNPLKLHCHLLWHWIVVPHRHLRA